MTISFLMPCYKTAFLRSAIQSILDQSVCLWELIIVDDCSPEPIKQIVDSFNDSRIIYHRNEKNIGGLDLVAQWNHCLSLASGDWVVMAADDDLYKPGFCEEVSHYIDSNPSCNLVRTRVEEIDQNNGFIWSDTNLPLLYSHQEFIEAAITNKFVTCIGNYVFKKSALIENGGFVNFPSGFCSDIATPILASVNGVANTENILFNFRHSPGHFSSNHSRLSDKLDAFTQYYNWLDNYLDKTKHSYLHKKCIFDYYFHVLKYISKKEYILYIQKCTNANFLEKALLTLRWLRNKK